MKKEKKSLADLQIKSLMTRLKEEAVKKIKE